ncbi:MAG: hypothetical protein R2850_06310 [Bacteroidia bacterium]
MLPSLNASFSPSTICIADGSVNLNNLITGDAGGTWAGTGVSGTSFNPQGLSGLVSITYTVGIGLCVNSSSQNLNIISSGDASFALPAGICEGVRLQILTQMLQAHPRNLEWRRCERRNV